MNKKAETGPQCHYCEKAIPNIQMGFHHLICMDSIYHEAKQIITVGCKDPERCDCNRRLLQFRTQLSAIFKQRALLKSSMALKFPLPKVVESPSQSDINPFQCKICGLEYRYLRGLQRHTSKKHSY